MATETKGKLMLVEVNDRFEKLEEFTLMSLAIALKFAICKAIDIRCII